MNYIIITCINNMCMHFLNMYNIILVSDNIVIFLSSYTKSIYIY